MRIIAREALRQFAAKHPDAESGLSAWYHTVRRAAFRTPNELLAVFPKASLLGNGVTVFNIGSHRLEVHMRYDIGIVSIRAVMTHPQYDRRNKERDT